MKLKRLRQLRYLLLLFLSATSLASVPPSEQALEVVNSYCLVTALVSGIQGRFLIDTGAPHSIVTPHFAKLTQMKVQTLPTGMTVSGVHSQSSIRRVVFKDKVITLSKVFVTDLNLEPGPYGSVDGVLGVDFVKQAPITLDLKKHSLSFETKESLEKLRREGASVPIKLDKDQIYVGLILNNELKTHLNYRIDTGTPHSFIRSEDFSLLSRSQNKSAHPSDIKELELTASHIPLGFQFKMAHIGVNDQLMVRDLLVRTLRYEKGALGQDYLRQFRVTLDIAGANAIFGKN